MGPSLPGGGAFISVAQFVQNLADSGLMPAAEARALAAAIPSTQNARPFAQQLVQRGKLTRYQAAMLYQGKPRGLVLGNYIVLDQLGAGGMGMVFKAFHRHLNKEVALKMLPPALANDAAAVKRFQREVQAAAKLSHPNIVHSHDADEFQGIHFLVMDLVEGSDLARVVKERGPLPIDKAIDCVAQTRLRSGARPCGRNYPPRHQAEQSHPDESPRVATRGYR